MFAILISLLAFGALQGADLTEQTPLYQTFPPCSDPVEYNLYDDDQPHTKVTPLANQENMDENTSNRWENICLFASTAGIVLGTGLTITDITGLSAIANFVIGCAGGSGAYVTGIGCYHAHKNVQAHMERKQADQNQKKLKEALRMSE